MTVREFHWKVTGRKKPMSDADALLASVLRKVIADAGTWTASRGPLADGTIPITIDGGAGVTPEEDAALTRAYGESHPAAVPRVHLRDRGFRFPHPANQPTEKTMSENETDATDERTSDERASSIEVGWEIRDFGDDDWNRVSIVDSHGDTMLLTYVDGIETTFDIDTVIERRLP